MQRLDVRGFTGTLMKAVAAAGTTTTYSTTGVTQYSIDGKAYSKAAVTNGATPTTDYVDGLAFTGITAGYGTVIVFGYDSGGTVRCMQGSVEALDVSGNFVLSPQLPIIPDNVAPFGYLVAKGGSTLSGTWTFGSSNLSSVTGMTYTFVDVMTLPERPQVS